MNKQRVLDAILRNDLASFTTKCFNTLNPDTQYKYNWHIDLISEYLQACEKRQIKRLIINIPPRHMKSIMVNIAWSAWLLGKNPSTKIISASYGLDLSRQFSIDTRRIINSDWYRRIYPNTKLEADQNTKGKFITTAMGHRFASAVGSSLTGEGGDYLIVDDPLKVIDASSKTKIEEANQWFDQSFTTRLNDKKNGVIVIIMQALHYNDLTHHLLNKGGNTWQLLKIPAEFKKKTIYELPISNKKIIKEKGDILFPEYQDKEILKSTKIDLGSRAYSAQYLQEPSDDEGGYIKKAWWRYYKNEGFEKVYQSWDTAIKEGQQNDYSVCTTWGIKNNSYYLIDLFKEKIDFPKLKKYVMIQYEKHNPSRVLIEDKASGQQLLQVLRVETKAPIIAIQPLKDKVTRLSQASIEVEAGRVFLPENKSFTQDFVDEISMFPSAAHDDIVDSFSQFINWARRATKHSVQIF